MKIKIELAHAMRESDVNHMGSARRLRGLNPRQMYRTDSLFVRVCEMAIDRYDIIA